MNPRAQAGGTLLGMFIGLVVGVLIAAGVVWYLNKTPLPFQAKGNRPPAEKPPILDKPLPPVMPPADNRFDELAKKLDALTAAVANIKPVPGPQGEPGPAGPRGAAAR